MPSYQLAVTEHFTIEWFSGVDQGGLYVFQNADTDDLRSGGEQSWKKYNKYLEGPQFFIFLSLIPNFINELEEASTGITVLSRVSYAFVPTFHRVPKKNGGTPNAAYYKPLEVAGNQRQELANGLKRGCSRENVEQLEENNPSESCYVLNNDYLADGVWASSLYYTEHLRVHREIIGNEVPPATLPQVPKNRIAPPSSTIYGQGRTLLRVARSRHRCSSGRCIDYVWIKENQQYIEHRYGSRTERYHVKCAFRYEKIPDNWLNPRFEQYHVLVALGLEGWVQQETQKREKHDNEKFVVPSDAAAVERLVGLVKAGYTLDQYEREDWRDHLRHTPVDLEPYKTAREFVGLANPLLAVGGMSEKGT